ncbi:Imm1 family immunity protein [Actinopolymorpha alba]|uniref:Imm1 family immunity protein n=1 Tax=Actinopolymorpha alba TaxID=533267 RepID=UPI0003737710|nr:Imm1 family immunity protein [Actinopolymorpha alba]
MTEPVQYLLEYGDGPAQTEVSTVDELDHALDEVNREAEQDQVPYAVYVFTPAAWDGPVLALGVGRDFSFLNFDNAHVVGDLDSDKPTEWWYGNDWGHRPPGRGIPVETAREAAREFVRTGQRPTNVEWIEAE